MPASRVHLQPSGTPVTVDIYIYIYNIILDARNSTHAYLSLLAWTCRHSR